MEPIILNKKYRIEKDSYSWVLIFSEKRNKENKKTKIKEPYLFEDKWYYPNIKQLLDKYISLDLEESEGILEFITKINQIYETINSLKNTIFKP